jgi:tRNA (guanine-N(7)-)-methyltransferase subunit TRM82
MEKCGKFLVAARGSNIDLFSLTDGSFLATWQCPSNQEPQKPNPAAQEVKPKLENEDSKSSSVDIIVEASAPPAKRRKLSDEDEQDENSANGQNGENKGGNKKNKKQNNRSESVASGLEAPAVIALAVTLDAAHVIAITGEDKSIRVFSVISQDGVARLQQLSQRQVPFQSHLKFVLTKYRAMPKRPSALAITDDNTTILSADKFGDVYSLPLVPPPEIPAPPVKSPPKEKEEKPFKPSANELTIHSQRNRKALANQKRQQKAQPQKTIVEFEHTLLLGHVSLLTDIKLAKSGNRTYVVTADRDEHIRVSRGIPQTHIIEGFCLGHGDFVSRVCIPKSRPEIMVSGGGDEELYVWEWEKGLLMSKAQLKAKVQDFVGEKLAKIAVLGIWHTRQAEKDVVFVTVQG